MSETLERAQQLQDALVEWRRHIHAHPELGFEEHETARLVADVLRERGLSVETGVGGTGVVARLGEGHPRIGVRAEMDALPIQEANDVPYRSQVPGVMHACGHDAHIAMALGAAELLAGCRDPLRGEVRFLFQPSEEVGDSEGRSGAIRMIEDGAVDGLDAILSLHVDSDALAGTVGIRSGYVTAAVDPFSATIIGSGCHSAFPHQGVNPITILAQVIHAVQGIVPLRVDPLRPAIVAIESVQAGDAAGVIPEEAHLTGNIRTFDEDVRQQLHGELRRALGLARLPGGDYRLTIESYSPAAYNDLAIAQMVTAAAREISGPDSVFEPEPRMYGEDFAHMASRVPGVLAFLGVRRGDRVRPLHSPIFDLDEVALPIGVAVLAESVARLSRVS